MGGALIRLAIAVAALAAGYAAYRVWKRPPSRLSRLTLEELGVSGPAIVQFSTQDCAPCRAARPRLIEAARRAEVDYTQIELDEHPGVAGRYGIRTVPTIVVTGRNGAVRQVWTRLPEDGIIAQAARRARAA